MLDKKDLQAIAKLTSDSEARPAQRIEEAEKRMMALMEGYFDPKFNLLADGHKLITEQMAKQEALEDLMESVEDRLDVLDSIVKLHSHEIAKLKKAQ